jgi:hypothetical protein
MIREVLLLAFLIIGLTCLSGCTQTSGNTTEQVVATTGIPTAIPTYKVTTVSSPVPSTTIPSTTIPATTVAIVNATLRPIADPTDVSQMQFTHYSDSDFSLDYPFTWKISKSSFILYNCVSVEANRCYQTEIQTIGPFDFNEFAELKKAVRIVTFTSADGTQKIVAFISDFTDGTNGNFILNPDLKWAQNQVIKDYPDIGASAVGNYQYSKSGNTMSSIFTVTAPAGSAEYPLAYTKKTFVTIHHIYEFALISDNENIQKYYNLNNYIFKSITPADKS